MRSRAFLLTFNGSNDALDAFAHSVIRAFESHAFMDYGALALEFGKKHERLHAHAYIHCASPRTVSGIVRMFPGAHVDVCKGTPKENRDYVFKDVSSIIDVKILGDAFWLVAANTGYEYGVLPVQGKRSDLDNIRDMVGAGASLFEIASTCRSYQSFKFAQVYQQLAVPHRSWKTYVLWLCGPTGAGKSRLANEIGGEAAYWKDDSPWWCGYTNQDVVIIDDFRGGNYKFNYILRMFDRYRLQLQVKGSHAVFSARVLIVTTPKLPTATFAHRADEDIAQIERRVDSIVQFSEETDYNSAKNMLKAEIEEYFPHVMQYLKFE